jgi:hypothetical protein
MSPVPFTGGQIADDQHRYGHFNVDAVMSSWRAARPNLALFERMDTLGPPYRFPLTRDIGAVDQTAVSRRHVASLAPVVSPCRPAGGLPFSGHGVVYPPAGETARRDRASHSDPSDKASGGIPMDSRN